MTRADKIAAAVLLTALTALYLSMSGAWAHQPASVDYSDWRSPKTNISCCHDEDCRATELCTLPTGMLGIMAKAGCSPIRDDITLPSPDGRVHICERNGHIMCVAIGGES